MPLPIVRRGNFKKVRPVRPLVCQSVCNTTKTVYSSFAINSRITIRISGERARLSLQEKETIFSKNY